MTTLLLLVACTGTATKPPPDTADSNVDTADSDSGADSADTQDTVDTVETADTTETGDTAPPTEWNPGDDVPGWEDADCTEPHPGRAYSMTFDDVYLAEAHFMVGMPGVGPHVLTVQARDCINFRCLPDTLDRTTPYVNAVLDATAGDDGQPRGLGEWGPDATTSRDVAADALSMLLDWDNGGMGRTPVEVTVCIERMRPDELRGTVRAEVFDYPYAYVNYYPSLVYRYPFYIRYPDRSGFDSTRPDSPADKPEGYDHAHILYDQPYEGAWPWDDITDASIREQLYERYTPYNAP